MNDITLDYLVNRIKVLEELVDRLRLDIKYLLREDMYRTDKPIKSN